MYLILCKLIFLFFTSFVILCLASSNGNSNYIIEVINFESDSRGFSKPVIALVAIPKQNKDKYPVIITQHGSTRDGINFLDTGGKTDEYSSRVISEGTKRGFAVIAIDAFFKTALRPSQKSRFPNAFQYAIDLKELLEKDERFDADNIFYTGFSYGARQVLKSLDGRVDYKSNQWRAIAAAEPGCNIISEPIKVHFPIMIIKGAESHYYIEPCKFLGSLIEASGGSLQFVTIKGANHFFSSNGELVNGVAVNGCRYNPVIKKTDGTMVFADGTVASRDLIKKRCFTKEAGKGKNRKYLNMVVDTVIRFFEKSKKINLRH